MAKVPRSYIKKLQQVGLGVRGNRIVGLKAGYEGPKAQYVAQRGMLRFGLKGGTVTGNQMAVTKKGNYIDLRSGTISGPGITQSTYVSPQRLNKLRSRFGYKLPTRSVFSNLPNAGKGFNAANKQAFYIDNGRGGQQMVTALAAASAAKAGKTVYGPGYQPYQAAIAGTAATNDMPKATGGGARTKAARTIADSGSIRQGEFPGKPTFPGATPVTRLNRRGNYVTRYWQGGQVIGKVVTPKGFPRPKGVR